MRISLRAGERIYINGAVLRATCKTTLELLNDVTFLLESHVIQPEDATTPLKQLYYALQTLLIDPRSDPAREAYGSMLEATRRSFSSVQVLVGLKTVEELTRADRVFEALKTIRSLFAVEERILSASRPHAAVEPMRSEAWM